VANIRIGAVEYLNTKPLICDLDLLAPDAALRLETPSRLAVELAEDRLDVALIPVIEYFRAGTYTLLPDIAIVSRGPVLSVTVFSRVPWSDIRSLALDEGSRTSAALTRILTQRRYGKQPEFVPLSTNKPAEEVDSDAVLLIGDRAMRAALPGFAYSYDLGQEWQDWTGLPFVTQCGRCGGGWTWDPWQKLSRRPRPVARSASLRLPTSKRAGSSWTRPFAGDILPTSSRSSWGRASWPDCNVTMIWPPS